MAEKQICLSYSSLSLFTECPRCFWLEKVKGISRPDTIFPSLPGGMDGIIKKYFDRFRVLGKLPPELEGKLEGTLFPDQKLLDLWRARHRGLRYSDKEVGATLMGLLDDCLVQEDRYLPLDYKTRGYPVKEDTPSYYQDQLNIYTLLLQENGYQTAGCAYLVFYHPLEQNDGGRITFHMHPVKVDTDPERARKIFREAVDLLSKRSCPSADSECGFCEWAIKVAPLTMPSSSGGDIPGGQFIR